MLRHAVSSKVQGTVKVRKFRKVRNLNSTPILICNPGPGAPRRPAEARAGAAAAPRRHGGGARVLREHLRGAARPLEPLRAPPEGAPEARGLRHRPPGAPLRPAHLGVFFALLPSARSFTIS